MNENCKSQSGKCDGKCCQCDSNGGSENCKGIISPNGVMGQIRANEQYRKWLESKNITKN